MSRPKVTVGMAVFDDFHGAYFTTQSLLLHHAPYVDEVVIIDNNPDSKHGKETAGLAGWNKKIKYAPFVGVNGTAVTRNAVFDMASGDVVVCLDPHVLLSPDALKHMLSFYSNHPEYESHLVQGPMLYDNLEQASTHFDLNVWRSEMWGIWDTDRRWMGADPFTIHAQGLGMFASFKKHWLRFNDQFRGFGGEEGYIHEKYRRHNRQTWCVPGFKWLHRFGRPDGVPYRLARYDKVRNYIIGHKENEMPLDNVHAHFVKGGALSEYEWEFLERGEYPPDKGGDCGCVGSKFKTLDDWFTYIHNHPSDINEHAPTLKVLAAGRRVVDFGHRVDVSSVAIAAGGPSSYHMIYGAEPREWPLLAKFLRDINPTLTIATTPYEPAPECDLLFLDTVHTGEYTYRYLSENAERVHDYVVIHDTVIFGEVGEDGKPGVMDGVLRFLRENRRWTVAQHDRNNHGLIVLCGNPELMPPLPSKLRQASNFAKALARHVATGGKKVSLEVFEQRLTMCDECPSRRQDKCSECGCPIEAKASWAVSFCPLEKWSAVAEGGAE